MSCREGCSLISGILAGEIPGFRIELCCFLHPFNGPWCFVVFPLLSCVMGLRNMTHKSSSACAEMILSYHLLPQQIFFTHKQESVASLLCGCLFFMWVVFVCVCFLCGFCFWFFVFRFLFSGNVTREYCQGPFIAAMF